jgi:hypothetical protein
MPFASWVGGDEMLKALDEAAGGKIPFFGTLAAEHSISERTPCVVFNGKSYDDRLAVVLLSGNVRPRFACVSIADGKISDRRAVVTDAEKNCLKTLNNIPAISYLETLGLAENGKLLWDLSIPAIIDHEDGTGSFSLIVVEQTPEGYIRLGGSVPVNSTLRIGAIDRRDVMESVGEITKLIEKEPKDVFLFFSCALRGLVLGLEQTAEIERVMALLDGTVPYLFFYAGGEICPFISRNGEIVNRYHNITAIGCAF